MNNTNPVASLIVLAGMVTLAGCSKGVEEGPPAVAAERSQDTPPPASAPQANTTDAVPTSPAPAGDATTIALVGLTMPKPESWIEAAPENSLQMARYIVPGPKGAGDATLVVFFFGPGMGGAVQNNIERWAGQFRSADGGPIQPEVSNFTVREMPVTLVELRGTYQGAGMTQPLPNQVFLSAIVDAPVGRVFLRLVGSAESVEANREAYMTLVNGVQKASQSG